MTSKQFLSFFFFFFLIKSVTSQEIPFGSPKYFSSNINLNLVSLSFENEYTFSDLDQDQITSISNGENLIQYIYLDFDQVISIQFKLDPDNFPSDGELYFIDPSIRGWIGPYRTNLVTQHPTKLTGQIKSSKVIIEWSSPIDEPAVIPVRSIIKVTEPNFLKSTEITQHPYQLQIDRDRTVILLTGYWPPSNEAIRPFSRSLLLNPEGWIGENWEDRGYNVVSYFPIFNPPDCSDCGQGSGDLEVDYQDTSNDFWNIVDTLSPVAIVTFSRGYIDYSWELEWKYFNLTTWSNDFTPPYLPTPNPPESDVPTNYIRYSSLPMDTIVAVIDSAGLGLTAYIDYTDGAGGYLSEFKGYHGVWYKAEMDSLDIPCYLAGHVHVGGLIDWETAHEAAKVTLREVIKIADYYRKLPGDVNNDGVLSIMDLLVIVFHLLGTNEMTEEQLQIADLNFDQVITIEDVLLLADIIMGI